MTEFCTNISVTCYNTYRTLYKTAENDEWSFDKLSERKLRHDDTTFMACLAEMDVAGVEAFRWAAARSVPEYLLSEIFRPERSEMPDQGCVMPGRISVAVPSKLERFYASERQMASVFSERGKVLRDARSFAAY